MKQFIPDKVYDVLKWVAMIVLPALSTLYLGLAKIWGWSLGPEIAQTLMLLDAFIGALLGLSSIGYLSQREED